MPIEGKSPDNRYIKIKEVRPNVVHVTFTAEANVDTVKYYSSDEGAYPVIWQKSNDGAGMKTDNNFNVPGTLTLSGKMVYLLVFINKYGSTYEWVAQGDFKGVD